MNEFKFTMKYEPEIKFNPKMPETITFENQVKCPKCGFPVTDKIGFMVAGGASRSKYHCGVCGYNFGSDEL